jgi:hypothetical protein
MFVVHYFLVNWTNFFFKSSFFLWNISSFFLYLLDYHHCFLSDVEVFVSHTSILR